MQYLENDVLRVGINEFGAELTSIVKKSDGTWATLYTKPIGDTYPIGMYGYFAGDKVPTNWLRCDGQLVLSSKNL